MSAEKLEYAWNSVQLHHPMLRARFLEDGTQEIMDKPYEECITVKDLRNRKDYEDILKEIRNELSHRKLKVEEGQVAGVTLSLLPDGQSRIHFDLDLLVADVQSLQIILRDLATVYMGKTLPEASKDWSFAAYLEAQKKEERAEKEQAEIYWNNRIDDFPFGPDLPLVKEPSKVKNTRFTRRIIDISKAEWDHLQRRAAEQQATPAMLLLAAYAMVLERWSKTKRFLINIPFFNRKTEYEGLEEVVADFTTLLLLEVDMRKRQTFGELLEKIQKQVHQDMKYTAYSGVQVQRSLIKAYGEKKNIAPVVFACNLGNPIVNNEFRDNLGEFSYMISQTPGVWLDFQVYEDEQGLMLTWDTVDELFPEGMIKDMIQSLEKILHILGEEKWNQYFDVLPEKQAAFIAEQKKIEPLHHSECLFDAFLENAKRNPEKTAVIDAGENVRKSYGELEKDALAVAAYFVKQGIKKQPIAISLTRGYRQAVASLGILLSGNLYVPVSLNQPKDRRLVIHEKTGIFYVITDERHFDSVEWPPAARILKLEDLYSEEPLKELPEICPDDPAYIIMTSGTTGLPKGAEMRHAGAWNTITDVNMRTSITSNDLVLGVSAMDFDLSVYDLFGMLNCGGTLVMIPEDKSRDAEFWLQQILKYQITVWNSVPILLDMLLIQAEAQHTMLPLKTVMLSGDWIGLDLPARVEKLTENCRFVSMGGATEASIWSNYFEVKLPLPKEWKSIPYGRPLAHQSYRVVDGNGLDTPFWVEGELWIGGAGVGTYRGDEELVQKKFVKDEFGLWYRTGDKGRFWNDGTIEFLGREDFQVKIRGHRIELGEIETNIKSIDSINESIVINDQGKLVAFYHLKDIELNTQESLQIDNEEQEVESREKVFDDLGLLIIMDYLIQKKCFIENNRAYSYNDLCRACRIDSRYKKLFEVWLNMMVKTNNLQFTEQKYNCSSSLVSIRSDTVRCVQDLCQHNFNAKKIYELVLNNEDIIYRIIQGDLDATYTLDMDKYMLTPNSLNKLLEQNQCYTEEIKAIIKQMSDKQNRKIRILEIGGYSKSIIDDMDTEMGLYIEKYTYLVPKNSEISEKNAISYKVEYINLDINDDLFSFKCGNDKYDMVIAYQSLHCAININEAFRLIRKILKKSGRLICVEPTWNSCFFNVVIGILENKFNEYTDDRLTRGELLLGKDKWRESAIKEGLQEIKVKDYGTVDKKVMFVWENMKDTPFLSENEIKKVLRKKLPHYMIPEFFVEMDVLPLSKNGKVDRKRVLSYLKECHFGRKEGSSAKTDFEIEVVNILKMILKQEEIFMEDNFFRLGGDSLRAIKFKNSILKRFDTNISIAQIFDSANIQEIILKIEQSILENTHKSIVMGEI